MKRKRRKRGSPANWDTGREYALKQMTAALTAEVFFDMAIRTGEPVPDGVAGFVSERAGSESAAAKLLKSAPLVQKAERRIKAEKDLAANFGEANTKRTENAKSRYQRYIEAVEKAKANNPKLTDNAAAEEVAPRFKTSARTILRALPKK
jgi:hypothetical protein